MSRCYRYARRYVGPLKAAILDWSGTTADRYVLAPTVAFVDTFKKHGVPISMEEARAPMGLRKDLHIKAIAENPDVRQRWRAEHGRDPDAADVAAMYDDFVPTQLSVLRQYTDLIPGCAEAVRTLRSQFGLKIGCTTGFVKAMVDVLLEEASKQGYVPDASVAGDEVVNGTRPKPFMLYRNMDLLDVHPIQAVLKVDDCVSGLEEAAEAGCWGVGVARYSNYMNVASFDEEAALSEAEMAARVEHSRETLRRGGAHYVVDSIADLPDVVADINQRLARGEQP